MRKTLFETKTFRFRFGFLSLAGFVVNALIDTLLPSQWLGSAVLYDRHYNYQCSHGCGEI